MDLENYLRNVDQDSVSKFSFAGTYKARVVSVYDGDTCKVIFFFRNVATKISIRLLGYDSPEIQGGSDAEKAAAIKARDYLSSLIMNNIVDIELGKNDQYGRPLAKIYTTDPESQTKICINDVMLSNNYGYEYYGGKKQEFESIV
jgi:endonuclease YncB( thermonuclease family)